MSRRPGNSKDGNHGNFYKTTLSSPLPHLPRAGAGGLGPTLIRAGRPRRLPHWLLPIRQLPVSDAGRQLARDAEPKITQTAGVGGCHGHGRHGAALEARTLQPHPGSAGSGLLTLGTSLLPRLGGSDPEP